MPGIADVFLHIGEIFWFGIFHLQYGGTIDDDFIPILGLFIVLLDCDIILFSQRKLDEIFAIASISRNSRTDKEITTFVYPNCWNPTAIVSII